MPTPPTKPLNIGSPRTAGFSADAGVSGSPGAGTPPVPNIPRFGTPGLAGTPGSLGARGAGTPGSFTSGVAGGRLGTPDVNVHELPDEEKARVLRRHLMSREEREAAAAGQAGAGSRRESDVSAVRRPSTVVRRQDTEAFPVPFEAPGADVTYVPSSSPYHAISTSI
jgi:proton-coupled amino acid transporter